MSTHGSTVQQPKEEYEFTVQNIPTLNPRPSIHTKIHRGVQKSEKYGHHLGSIS